MGEAIAQATDRAFALTGAGRVQLKNAEGRIDGLKAALDIVAGRIDHNQFMLGDEAGWRAERVKELEEVRRQIECLVKDWQGGA